MSFSALDGNNWTANAARAGFPILVEYARLRRPITYGEWDAEIVRRRLGRHVLPMVYRFPAGSIGRACQEYARETGILVPMMNLLVVNRQTGIPGDGADDFLSTFCSDFLNRKVNPKRVSHRERRAIIERAHQEIFDFGHWPDLLKAFGLAAPIPPKGYSRAPNGKKHGRRPPDPRNWHFGPEKEDHKNLKMRIAASPVMVGLARGQKGKSEWRLWSGDEVDVHFEKANAAVEVKAHSAQRDELLRGIFQCIKYKAVLQAQQIYQRAIPTADCILAVGGELPVELKRTAKLFGVKYFDRLASP